MIKALLSPSRRPFDSAGLAVGYRFRDGAFFADSSESGGLVLFVGHFWTKGDNAGTNEPVPREKSWRVGMSYSLDNLLDWIK